ncbi:YrhK family protein [Novosphingobium aquimarinum]|uniref:YrhK family protein n=1 Tax=Novosphingobium aquimarinum TaxID=2682494 RepID=UPI0012ECB940|nr:YrhK family protein [Novosphingobium aquimarinum]
MGEDRGSSGTLKTLVRDFRWAHLGVGILGNLTFLVGSVLFLPSLSEWKTWGVILFIVGSALMFVGALGEFILKAFYPTSDGDRSR